MNDMNKLDGEWKITELDRELWLENHVKYLTDDDTKQMHEGNEDLCKRCIYNGIAHDCCLSGQYTIDDKGNPICFVCPIFEEK